jgi:hypothetical protein
MARSEVLLSKSVTPPPTAAAQPDAGAGNAWV